MLDLTEIKERTDAATNGPWMYGGQGWVFGPGRLPVNGKTTSDPMCDLAASTSNDEDAIFIAHARADVPALVAEVERMRGSRAVPFLEATARLLCRLGLHRWSDWIGEDPYGPYAGLQDRRCTRYACDAEETRLRRDTA